ncbi:hypothetical protein LEM8419_01836 [Neolewinella maritima]|uniref:UspA domain-containing protein n=1 Tax=Neolewinella maritima TaxID=1383882 RepID=A0ABM9B0T5_9BACT|nr:universal stress protein [Neolewinella maritima]CAH1000702.1 hypothetical protein LEM8419_01836 [Neolewinella maritima]
MSRILIPVDFSLACHNAYRFGLHLAEELTLDVVLTHYYSGSIDPRGTLYIGGDGTIHGSHLERLRQFAYATAESPSYPSVEPPCGVEVTYEVEVRMSPAAAIIQRAHQADISMVVMPPRSSDGFLGKWLGSTATTVSEACDRPIYLVPPHCRYRPFRHVVVANNHATADPYPLWQLEGLAEYYASKVHFVHVEVPDRDLPLRFVPWELMHELTEAKPGADYAYEVVSVEDKDISHGLLDYAERIDANLIVIVNQTRSRWQAILRRTLTQDLALRSRFPLLVLHNSTAAQAKSTTQQTETQAS